MKEETVKDEENWKKNQNSGLSCRSFLRRTITTKTKKKDKMKLNKRREHSNHKTPNTRNKIINRKGSIRL